MSKFDTKTVEGATFVGSITLGVGIGMLWDEIVGGIVIGIGLWLLLMARTQAKA